MPSHIFRTPGLKKVGIPLEHAPIFVLVQGFVSKCCSGGSVCIIVAFRELLQLC